MKANRSYVGKLASGELVVLRPRTHDHGVSVEILRQTLAKIHSTKRDFIVCQVGFGQVIGKTLCVPTGPLDRIVQGYRPNRAGRSRFVIARQPEDTDSVTVILAEDRFSADARQYVLITSFLGTQAQPEPWDEGAFARDRRGADAARNLSRLFWDTHALVFSAEEIVCSNCSHIFRGCDAVPISAHPHGCGHFGMVICTDCEGVVN